MIKNGSIVTMDEFHRIIENGAIYIEDQWIRDIGNTRNVEKAHRADIVIDAADSVVMPGLINLHVHFASSLMRGVEDDLPLEQWLSKQPPPGYMSEEWTTTASRLMCLEMIKAGVTCYLNGAMEGKRAEIDERYRSGLRGFLAFLIQNKIEDYGGILQFIQNKRYSDRLQLMLGPWWVPKVSEGTLRQVRDISEKNNLKIRIHVAESLSEIQQIRKKHRCEGSIEYLDKLDLLSPRLIAVHCIHVSPSEINMIKRKGVGVVHCPTSNAKLGDGIAPLTEFIKAGITVGLGSDGVATNNCIDIFQEMKLACLLQRAVHHNPRVIRAEDVLRMATINGAKLLGIDNKIGSLEIGKKADIIILDFRKPHLYPRTNIISHIVYSSSASDVNTTIVDGKILMRNREVLTLEEFAVLEKAQEIYQTSYPEKTPS